METLVFNFGGTSVRTETLEGIEYWVAPMVMAVEGVLDGSDGAIFYSGDELAKSPMVWNHKPIIVYHAEVNGEPVSGCSPEVLEKQKIGIIMNTEWDGRLFAEAWIDKKKVNKVDVRVENAIKHGVKLEVSTGLFCDQAEDSGEFKGKQYSKVASNIRPDHLAILPDQIGACSLADGAGFLVNQKHPVVNELSFNNIRSRLFELLCEKFKSNGAEVDDEEYWFGYVEDVYPSFVIYSSGDSGLMRHGYMIDKQDNVSLTGEPIPVTRVISYQLSDGTVITSDGGRKMATHNSSGKATREARVTAVITANTGWTEAERGFLSEMPEPQFHLVEKNATSTAQAPPVAVTATPAVLNPAPAQTAPVQQSAPLTMAEYIAQAPAELREVLNNSVAVHNREKSRLVGIITANTRNKLSANYLNSRSIEELEGIAELAAPVENAQQVLNHGYSYAGAQGAAPVTNAADDDEILHTPVMTFGK